MVDGLALAFWKMEWMYIFHASGQKLNIEKYMLLIQQSQHGKLASTDIVECPYSQKE